MSIAVVKTTLLLLLLCFSEFLVVINSEIVQDVAVNASSINCVQGEVVGGVCRCYPGWMGSSCSLCGGRIRLVSRIRFNRESDFKMELYISELPISSFTPVILGASLYEVRNSAESIVS